MSWSHEPSIEEILSEPIFQMVMARDGVTASALRRVVEETKSRLDGRQRRPARACLKTVLPQPPTDDCARFGSQAGRRVR